MTEQGNNARAVWDPTANNGAGGWVRRPITPDPASPSAQSPLPGPNPPQAPAAAPYPVPPAAPPRTPAATPVRPPRTEPGPTGPAPQQAPPAAPPGPAPYAGAASQSGGFPQAAPPPPFGGQQGYPDQPGYGEQPGYGQQPGYGNQQSFGGQGFNAPPQPFSPQQPYNAQPPGGGQPPFGQQPPFGRQPNLDPQPDFAAQPEFDYEEDPRRRRTPVLVGAAVALLLVIGVGVVWAVQNSGDDPGQAKGAGTAPPPPASSGTPGDPQSAPAASGSPSASASASASAGAAGPNAAAQAKALDALLTKGENAKAPIGSAVAKVRSCPAKPEVESAAKVFDTGAEQRDQLITELAGLQTSDLPGGAEAVQTLKTAWQQSGDIDRAYATWARTVSTQGCTNGSAPTTADLNRANDLNPQATQSKKDFVAKWKPIADAYGLTARTWDRI
ncbi:hypothetical protein AB0K51_22660 [Kitasatospora sp. NPDC049285]|uniref:hypothetical protein n=1 Tax=Kitasatospora sp. NPDC049285 TaxID=3157096 RepID=UPI00342E1D7C